MSFARVLVTTHAKGRKQTAVWNPGKPFAVGPKANWNLESVDGAYRLRNRAGEIVPVIQQERVRIPGSDADLEIRFAKSIRAPYLDAPPGKGVSAQKLYAFSGLRRVVTNFRQIEATETFATENRDIFTAIRKETMLQIKVLAEGLTIKFKGKEPAPGPIGTVWEIKPEDLDEVTLVRGLNWWRFSLRAVGPALLPEKDQDGGFWKEAALAVLLFILIGGAISLLIPPSTPEVPVTKPDELKKPAAMVVHFAHRPHQVVEEEPVMHSTPEVAPGKTNDGALSGGQSRAEEAAKRAAQSSVNTLKNALSGASSLVQNHDFDKVNGATSTKGILSRSGPAFSATEVAAGLSSGSVKVGAVGGSGSGGSGAGTGTSVGYGSGEHGSVAGQGRALTSVEGDGAGAEVEEGLTKEEVGAVIHQHLSEIRYCHEQAMLNDPRVEGKLVLDFKIDPSGLVETETVQSSTLCNGSIEQCILRRLSTWKFPHPRGGVHVGVSYPFLFKTLQRD